MSNSEHSRWGLVATIKAPAIDILNFAAYHLEAGAHRLFLYLDAPCPDAMPFLKAHPKIRVILCDDAHWQKRRKSRPIKHQVRQTLNATRAYRRQAGDVDWLIHMDVDEFLWSEQPVHTHLGPLPQDVFCARARPIESLAGDGTAFKGHIPNDPARSTIVRQLYPRFGDQLKTGFLSHDQGKLFVRTGAEGIEFRIHNVFREGESNPDQIELSPVDLCHVHSKDWDSWFAHYRYRLQQGSYRPELAPNRRRELGGITLHELLTEIETENGLSGLRAFYDELCADTPELRARLHDQGLLKIRRLHLTEKRQKQFPAFG
ncbi:glycosyltransferase family 2 protein [Parasedimentitalea huanghaiensis]|uniref:Glycosyltransferase family 2 protein n=1 Tax=Parasedimentitalea huanghaiensis TaxID=2682100 RepID=A0A6L6WDU3_9RHOB|nr:glycosyltransferase family 2 protein [Zongyanglinia huanghaiensis]MVO15874.1 glycosyltransferase family 2 protein [Zongyanglinia huanghaiensis]